MEHRDNIIQKERLGKIQLKNLIANKDQDPQYSVKLHKSSSMRKESIIDIQSFKEGSSPFKRIDNDTP